MKENRFSALALAPAQLRNLASLGYSEMTPIQSLSLPHLLEGKDVIAQSKTGSGKTAAYAIPLLHKILTRHAERGKQPGVKALVLVPTRELCDQTRSFAQALSEDRRDGEFSKPFTWFPASATVDGVKYENIGLRKKGFIGSLDSERPSLKIKLNYEHNIKQNNHYILKAMNNN